MKSSCCGAEGCVACGVTEHPKGIGWKHMIGAVLCFDCACEWYDGASCVEDIRGRRNITKPAEPKRVSDCHGAEMRLMLPLSSEREYCVECMKPCQPAEPRESKDEHPGRWPKLREWLETAAAVDGYRYQIPMQDFRELRDYIRSVERCAEVHKGTLKILDDKIKQCEQLEARAERAEAERDIAKEIAAQWGADRDIRAGLAITRLKDRAEAAEKERDELKPCPWCGSEPQLLYYPDDVVAALNQAIFGCWYTRCQVNPKVRTLTTSRLEPGEYEYLVERWNRRPTND